MKPTTFEEQLGADYCKNAHASSGLSRWLVQEPLGQSTLGLQAFRVQAVLATGASRPSYRLVLWMPTDDTQGNEAAAQSLANQAVAAEVVRHQGVLPIVDAELDAAPFFLVQPWLPHVPFGEWRQRHREVSWSRLLWIARQMAEIVSASHERGRAHGNLNRDHVLICHRDRVTIVGWSNSQWMCHTSKERWNGPAPLLAPPAGGREVDGSGDVLALGDLIFSLVTGATRDELEMKELDLRSRPGTANENWPWRLSAWNRQCPNELCEMVDRMLQASPSARPQVHQVLDCLLGLEIDHLGDERILGGIPGEE